ncbi:MFS transporter [Nonomuraea harbinensis]|uniref:MFS transporter n=1 Tax=Nonomuraea harbinensis TaxID=1286938 RepID=A0ABW1BXG6_9ACTN|nr:MFS transporter [Nonomuraea harbinensis]
MTAPKALDTPYDAPRIFGPAYRTATLGILLVVTLVAFEGMSVSVIMPEVSKDLRALELYGVSFSAFFIASLFANVVAGLWADRRGYALPFLAGLVLFVLGMALAGAATGKEMFLLARAVQGLGAGPTVVALYVMIARVYPQDVRPRVFAALSAAWVLPSMIGPSVAGFVAEHLGWRWVFYGIIPLVVPALLMLLPSLRRPSDDHEPATGPRSRPVAMTVAATATAVGSGVLLYGVEELYDAPLVSIVWCVLGLAALGYGLARLLPPGALRFGRGLPTTVMMRGLFAAAFFGVNGFIPLALTDVKGFTTAQAGIALTTGALGWSAGSYLQSRRVIDPYRRIRMGAACVTAGILLVVPSVVAGVTGWVAVPAWIVAGFGMGMAMATINVTALKQSPVNEQGANSAALSVTDMLGAALALGVGGALSNVIGFTPSQIAVGFAVICGLMALIGLAATFLSARVTDPAA